MERRGRLWLSGQAILSVLALIAAAPLPANGQARTAPAPVLLDFGALSERVSVIHLRPLLREPDGGLRAVPHLREDGVVHHFVHDPAAGFYRAVPAAPDGTPPPGALAFRVVLPGHVTDPAFLRDYPQLYFRRGTVSTADADPVADANLLCASVEAQARPRAGGKVGFVGFEPTDCLEADAARHLTGIGAFWYREAPGAAPHDGLVLVLQAARDRPPGWVVQEPPAMDAAPVAVLPEAAPVALPEAAEPPAITLVAEQPRALPTPAAPVAAAPAPVADAPDTPVFALVRLPADRSARAFLLLANAPGATPRPLPEMAALREAVTAPGGGVFRAGDKEWLVALPAAMRDGAARTALQVVTDDPACRLEASVAFRPRLAAALSDSPAAPDCAALLTFYYDGPGTLRLDSRRAGLTAEAGPCPGSPAQARSALCVRGAEPGERLDLMLTRPGYAAQRVAETVPPPTLWANGKIVATPGSWRLGVRTLRLRLSPPAAPGWPTIGPEAVTLSGTALGTVTMASDRAGIEVEMAFRPVPETADAGDHRIALTVTAPPGFLLRRQGLAEAPAQRLVLEADARDLPSSRAMAAGDPLATLDLVPARASR
jgi:hypothetical protein